MPEEVLWPTANAAVDNWHNRIPALDYWESINSIDDATYIDRTEPDGVAGYYFAALEDLPEYAKHIRRVQVTARWKYNSAEGTNARNAIVESATTIDSANFVPTTSFAAYTHTYSPAAGLWTPAKINALQAGVWGNQPGAGNTFYVSALYVTVLYYPSPGAWIFSVLPWAAPLLGAHVLLREIPALAREVWVRSGRRRRILPEEYRSVWAALRAARRVYA